MIKRYAAMKAWSLLPYYGHKFVFRTQQRLLNRTSSLTSSVLRGRYHTSGILTPPFTPPTYLAPPWNVILKLPMLMLQDPVERVACPCESAPMTTSTANEMLPTERSALPLSEVCGLRKRGPNIKGLIRYGGGCWCVQLGITWDGSRWSTEEQYSMSKATL